MEVERIEESATSYKALARIAVIQNKVEIKRTVREYALSQAAYYLTMSEKLGIEIEELLDESKRLVAELRPDGTTQ